MVCYMCVECVLWGVCPIFRNKYRTQGQNYVALHPGKQNLTRVSFQKLNIGYTILWVSSVACSTIARWLGQQGAIAKARDRSPTGKVVKEPLLRNR